MGWSIFSKTAYSRLEIINSERPLLLSPHENKDSKLNIEKRFWFGLKAYWMFSKIGIDKPGIDKYFVSILSYPQMQGGMVNNFDPTFIQSYVFSILIQ